MADCVEFITSATPEGPLDLPVLADHLQKSAPAGQGDSDFRLFDARHPYQHGLNLMRAFNLDIAVIQVLTRQEVEPPFATGS